MSSGRGRCGRTPSERTRARVGATVGFVDGLRDAGLVEDRDFIIDYRSADEQYDRLPGLAAKLVQRRVSVLGATPPPSTGALPLRLGCWRLRKLRR